MSLHTEILIVYQTYSLCRPCFTTAQCLRACMTVWNVVLCSMATYFSVVSSAGGDAYLSSTGGVGAQGDGLYSWFVPCIQATCVL